MTTVNGTLTQVIEEAARAGDSDIDATAHLLELGKHAHTAIEGHAAHSRLLAKGADSHMDLLRQFPCGRNNEGTHVAVRTLEQAL